MPTQPSVEDYIQMLKDPDTRVRAQAIEKLSELGAKQAVKPLIKLIHN